MQMNGYGRTDKYKGILQEQTGFLLSVITIIKMQSIRIIFMEDMYVCIIYLRMNMNRNKKEARKITRPCLFRNPLLLAIQRYELFYGEFDLK